MEQRKSNIFMPFLLNALKAKKSWVLLSTVIIFVTTLLIPYILEAERADTGFFMTLGIFEAFVLVFINCLIDNSFLHNDSKLAYYKSKPLSLREQISANIITEIVFAGFLSALIAISMNFKIMDYGMLKSFKIIIPWLLTGIFLASLSSILAGNTLIAGVITIFNFALPGIIYLIIVFMFSILENLVPGFSTGVLVDHFLNKVYKLEYIYFAGYLDKSLDYVYFLILGIILTVITLLIFKTLKGRKNENTGNFIVFDGYKYFVSVLACLIIPAFFSVSNYGRNIAGEIIVSLLMAALTYYVIIAVMEKSFKISGFSAKVFIISMAVFVAATGGTVAFANRYKDVVPDAEDVKYAYVDTNVGAFNFINNTIENKGSLGLSYDDIIKLKDIHGIILSQDKENIRDVIDLHKELLTDRNYNNEGYDAGDLSIVYFMNDGSFIIREYKTEAEDSGRGNEKKDELASKILNSEEFKGIKYNYLYDEEYCKENYDIDISLVYGNSYGGRYEESGENIIASDISLDEIRPYLVKDINEQLIETDKAFLALGSSYLDQPYKDFDGPSYYLQIVVRDRKDNDIYYVQNLYFGEGYENTEEYLKSKLPELR